MYSCLTLYYVYSRVCTIGFLSSLGLSSLWVPGCRRTSILRRTSSPCSRRLTAEQSVYVVSLRNTTRIVFTLFCIIVFCTCCTFVCWQRRCLLAKHTCAHSTKKQLKCRFRKTHGYVIIQLYARIQSRNTYVRLHITSYNIAQVATLGQARKRKFIRTLHRQ